MTERLPTVGGDADAWATILNGFLLVAHNADGTAKNATGDVYMRYGDAALQSLFGSVGGKGGIALVGDTTLYRDASGILRTNSEFRADGVVRSSFTGGTANTNMGAVGPSSKGGMVIGADTNIYRDSANVLKTDDAFVAGSTVQIVGNVGFYNTTPAAKPTVSGSRGGNAALASLLTGLAGLGLITDSSSA